MARTTSAKQPPAKRTPAKPKAVKSKAVTRKAVTAKPSKAKAAKPRRPKRLTWTVARPSRSHFGGVTGDDAAYQVRMLEVPDPDDPAVINGIVELMLEMFRRAEANVTKQRNLVLFAWDPVYSRLTVTYTDRKRRQDGRDVLKLSCSGWDAEIQALSIRKGLAKGEARGEQIRDWIEVSLGEAKEIVELLTKQHGVRFGFTTDVEDTTYELL